MHVIRLRGHWDSEKVAPGVIRYRRRFGRPTGLETGEPVWLVIEGLQVCAQVALNSAHLGETLPSGEPKRFEIGTFLNPRNELWLDIEPSASDPSADPDIEANGLQVRLEIEA